MNTDHSLHSACLYRLQHQRLRQAGHHTREAAEDTDTHLRDQRLRQASLLATETPEQTVACLQDQRLWQAAQRAGEDVNRSTTPGTASSTSWPSGEGNLQDEQVVVFQPSDAHDVAMWGPPVTKLTAYFTLNQTDPESTTIRYPDIYEYCWWTQNSWVWLHANRNRPGTMDQDDDDTASSDMIGHIPVVNLNARQSELHTLLAYAPPSQSGCNRFPGLVHLGRRRIGHLSGGLQVDGRPGR